MPLLVLVAALVGALAAWQVGRLRRRGDRRLLVLTAGVVVVLVGLGMLAWRTQAGRVAHVALVGGYVLTSVLTPIDRTRPDTPAPPSPPR